MLLEGIFAPATTPFYSDERVYLKKVEHNIARLSLTALSGIVMLGSTGECVALDDAETTEVLRVAAGATSEEKVLIAGVGRESVSATLKVAEAAAGFHYDAVLVRNPSYYRPQLTDAALLHYFRSVADRSPLPVILYSIPKFTEFEIPGAVVAELADHPNILGIKESSGSMERLRNLIELTRKARTRSVTVTPVFEAVTGRMLLAKPAAGGSFISVDGLAAGEGAVAIAGATPAPAIKMRTREVGFQVLSGSTNNLKEALDAGVVGAILGFAACAPQACQEIYTAWKERDQALAAEKQARTAKASDIVASQYGIAGIKYACDFNGYYGGKPRSPLLPLDATAKARVEESLADIRN
jgi:dihydrodipicolinate synthase/N-acetylneuraminate lyase